MNYRITGDFRVPFRTASEETCVAFKRLLVGLQPNGFLLQDISLCRATSSVQDRNYHQGGQSSMKVEAQAVGALISQVRADIPEQNYGGNVQIYCMLPKDSP